MYQPVHIFFELKWTVLRDFRPPVFSSFEPAWVTDQWVNIFLILVKISLSYLNLREKGDSLGYDAPERLTRQGIIYTLGVMFWRIFYWLAGVWYPGEIDLLPISYPRGDWLAGASYHGAIYSLGVSYHGDIDSLGYHTLEDGLAGGIITRRILNQNRKDLNPLVSGAKQFVLTLLKPATGLNVFFNFSNS